ncbi:hypothetical protein [Streptomyces sp. NPDC050355]|uniref:hypothetical protein n=1 Tax=Streptomyces sp. NPDC050355 TaxID=3365609 RepID=UPI0037B9C1D7
MDTLTDIPGKSLPDGGVTLSPLEVRGRDDPGDQFADLPKTVSGKIRRSELRERTAQGDGGAEYLEENHR